LHDGGSLSGTGFRLVIIGEPRLIVHQFMARAAHDSIMHGAAFRG
jgi:hypothetical protein